MRPELGGCKQKDARVVEKLISSIVIGEFQSLSHRVPQSLRRRLEDAEEMNTHAKTLTKTDVRTKPY